MFIQTLALFHFLLQIGASIESQDLPREIMFNDHRIDSLIEESYYSIDSTFLFKTNNGLSREIFILTKKNEYFMLQVILDEVDEIAIYTCSKVNIEDRELDRLKSLKMNNYFLDKPPLGKAYDFKTKGYMLDNKEMVLREISLDVIFTFEVIFSDLIKMNNHRLDIKTLTK